MNIIWTLKQRYARTVHPLLTHARICNFERCEHHLDVETTLFICVLYTMNPLLKYHQKLSFWTSWTSNVRYGTMLFYVALHYCSNCHLNAIDIFWTLRQLYVCYVHILWNTQDIVILNVYKHNTFTFFPVSAPEWWQFDD